MTTDANMGRPTDEEVIHSFFREAAELIKRLEGSSVRRLALEAAGYKVEIERGVPAAAGLGGGAPLPAAERTGEAALPAATDNRYAVVAPLLGTFYRSPQPGAKPFVDVGSVVSQGQPVAIVEAMKIMNQIVSERGGRVAEIVAKDGDWVEFQQPLMYLEPIEE